MTDLTFQDAGTLMSEDREDGHLAALCLAVLVSFAIHCAMLFFLPGQQDSGVANFGQGGTVISLGPSGREAGGEVATAEGDPDAPEEVAASELQAVEAFESTEAIDAEELTPVLEADLLREQEALDSPEIHQPEPAEQPALAEAVELEPDASTISEPLLTDTDEIQTAEVVPVQEDLTQAAASIAPPVPKRRPLIEKKIPPPALQKTEKVAAPRKNKQLRKTLSAAEPTQDAKSQDAVEQVKKGSAEGQDATASENQVAGEGGRSGHSGQSEIGQGDNTPGGGRPGADSDYYKQVLAWLEKHKRYPRRSKLRNEEGVVLLHFVVTRDGSVTLFSIKESSGHKRLDKEALGMIERAQPLPAMPGDMRQAKLDLVIPVKFQLR
ncbi:energy transducer TonB [Pelagibius sp. Alg239-R121]|uniref:energy transducer TonB n=1 Tax=Pelagibius sp. Alg239-R121 TaxID=2993448 RepID=UPI0024A7256F|nr:energy transducer TonB [Pelagibius sp. Alg239-R121]